MPLEDATHVNSLNPYWPLGSDQRFDGDDHLRLVKTVLQNMTAVTNGINLKRDDQWIPPDRFAAVHCNYNFVSQQKLWIPAGIITPRELESDALIPEKKEIFGVTYDTMKADKEGLTNKSGTILLKLPDTWGGGDVTAKFHYITEDGQAGAVRWAWGLAPLYDGSSMDGAYPQARAINTENAGPDVLQVGGYTGSESHPAPASQYFNCRIYRHVPNAADTYPGAAWLLGVELRYSPTQANGEAL